MRAPEPVVPVAGCTDLYVAFQMGRPPGARYLNLWGLDALRAIEERDGVLAIGALATYARMMRDERVQRRLPMLVAASREVGGAQVQSRGTIGGNVCNASPAGDTLPVLAAAEAVVVLRSASGARRIPYTDFATGYRTTRRRRDEILVALELPAVEGTQWFRKVGTRAAQAISKVVMAGVRGPSVRVAFGSVGPTVVRCPRTEAALEAGDLPAAQRALQDEIHPVDDLRSTATYRRRVAANLLARFWSDTA